MNLRWLVAVAACWVMNAGHAAMFVPETDNPAKKVALAGELFDLNRPLPAVALLREAIPVLQAEGKHQVVGHAYRSYAGFVLRMAVQGKYKAGGQATYLDGDKFDDPQDAARHYFGKALAAYRQAEAQLSSDPDSKLLLNLYFNGAFAALMSGDPAASCEMSAKAIQAMDRLDADDKRPQKQKQQERDMVGRLRTDAKCADPVR